MANPEVTMPAADEEMAEVEAENTAADETLAQPTGGDDATGLEDIEPEVPERTTFLE